MVFSSYVVGLFGLFILEFSLWNNFGNYIWYVSIGFTILDMVIGDIVSYQLKEVGGTCSRRYHHCTGDKPVHPRLVPGLEHTPEECSERAFPLGW